MEMQYSLKKPASHKSRKRVGRGTSSGHGKTSCRGQKGQMSRSGAKSRSWFEGGQMPLQRRVPKRGFNNKFRTEFQIVNIGQIDKIGMDEVTPQVLVEKGVIKNLAREIKILGNGDLTRSVKVHADAFSASAKEKITKAGGSAIVRTEVQK